MNATDKMGKIGLIVVTAVAFAAGIVINPIFLAVGLVLAVVDYFIIPRFDVEYEYLYVNGTMDIDRIFSKSKRKKAVSLELSNMEILAPVKSHQLDAYNQNAGIKVQDFSSRNQEHKIYAMIISEGKERMKVLLELDDKMLKDLKQRFPRKVFLD